MGKTMYHIQLQIINSHDIFDIIDQMIDGRFKPCISNENEYKLYQVDKNDYVMNIGDVLFADILYKENGMFLTKVEHYKGNEPYAYSSVIHDDPIDIKKKFNYTIDKFVKEHDGWDKCEINIAIPNAADKIKLAGYLIQLIEKEFNGVKGIRYHNYGDFDNLNYTISKPNTPKPMTGTVMRIDSLDPDITSRFKYEDYKEEGKK